MFAEDLGGDTVSSRTFPLGSVNSKAGLLTSGAFSSDPMPMDGSCWHESSGGSSTIWEPRPCEVTALFPDETDEYDVSYCRWMWLLLMNLSRDAFNPMGSQRRSRRSDFWSPARESRKMDA